MDFSDVNIQLGLLFIVVGCVDIGLGRMMTQLPERARTLITFCGVAFLLGGAMLLSRLVRLI